MEYSPPRCRKVHYAGKSGRRQVTPCGLFVSWVPKNKRATSKEDVTCKTCLRLLMTKESPPHEDGALFKECLKRETRQYQGITDLHPSVYERALTTYMKLKKTG